MQSVKTQNRNLITAGGRVVSVAALAGNIKMAIQSAYKAVNKIALILVNNLILNQFKIAHEEAFKSQ